MAAPSIVTDNLDVDMIDVSHEEKSTESQEQYESIYVDLDKEASSDDKASLFEVEDANKVVSELENECGVLS